jgi:RNA polymerase sigma-70 factor, ECF subfamily
VADQVEDKMLISATAAGNTQAFSELYSRFHDKMVRYAKTILVGNTGEADDAYNAAFLDIWRSAGSFSGQGSAEGWIRRIVRNKSIDLLRGVKEKTMLNDKDVHATQLIVDVAPGPEDNAIASSQAKALHDALMQLTLDHREVVWLCYFEAKGVSDIAEIVGCPENTVKTRLYHARKHLHLILSGNPP